MSSTMTIDDRARTTTTADGANDDRALVARMRAGDEAAFARVVRSHGGRMLSVARRILGNDDDARDAVQAAFLSAFRALDSFQGDALLSTWLHRIVVNAALMSIRSRRRKPEEPLSSLLPRFDEQGHHVEPVSPWDPPDRHLMREETRARVRAAIARLPERHRTVLMLRDVEELSTDEVATLLGATPNAVKIRLHRARQALATLLKPEFASAGLKTRGSRGEKTRGSGGDFRYPLSPVAGRR